MPDAETQFPGLSDVFGENEDVTENSTYKNKNLSKVGTFPAAASDNDITEGDIVTRELALIKVKATSSTRSEIIQIVDIFRASIVDVASDSVTIEVTGDEEKITSLFDLLRGFGIKEVSRTGRIAMTRGGTEGKKE